MSYMRLCVCISQMSDRVQFNPNIRAGTLDNGLNYYVLHNAKPANRAELRLVVRVGSMNEREDERGLAHFVEQ